MASISALIAFVSTLGSTSRERALSRLIFYSLVLSSLWTMNRLVPDSAEAEAAKWEALGVARPYIGVPVEEVERILFRASR